MLAGHGEERSADVGDVLFRVGDRRYPFIAIIEGEAAILDASGNEIIRHGTSGFLGEVSLLSGQTAFVTAVATKPMRYIAVDRDELRPLMFEDGPLGDLLLSSFMARRETLQRQEGVGIEIIGPRSSESTRHTVDYVRRNRLPHVWRDPEHSPDVEAAVLIEGLEHSELPLVRLPGGVDLRNPSNGELSRALGIGLELSPSEEVDLLVIGGGPAGLGAAVYGASEGLSTLVVEGTALGGQAGTSRRIENYLGFPAGIAGSELTSRAITQARKFEARTATPYRAIALEPGNGRHLVRLEDDHEVSARAVLLATGAEYRRLPIDDLADYEGISVFYAAGPPEAQRCGATRVGVIGGGNSAAQAAVWLARGGALVTLLHRRGGPSRDDVQLPHPRARALRRRRPRPKRSDVSYTEPTANSRPSPSATERGLRSPSSSSSSAPSPAPGWLGDAVARDEKGFVLTGAAAGAEGLLETSVPGVYAAGDVRSGSVKRCATAVGEGAMVVQFVHRHLAATAAERSSARRALEICRPSSTRSAGRIRRPPGACPARPG